MQQTTKYKLDLIEKDDVFSPDALNQNMEKVEEVLAGEEAARTAADAAGTAARAALDARITTLEGKTIAVGSYNGVGASDDFNSATIPLPFTPSMVIVQWGFGSVSVFTREHPFKDHNEIAAKIVDNGFFVTNTTSANFYVGGMTYTFIAFPE